MLFNFHFSTFDKPNSNSYLRTNLQVIKLATIRKVYSLRFDQALPLFLPFFYSAIVGKIIELGILFSQHHFEYPKTIVGWALVREAVFIGLVFWVLFLFAPQLYKRWMKIILGFLLSVTLVFQLISTFYFVLTAEPVSIMLLDFSFGEMTTIARDYLVFKTYYLLLPVSVLLFWIGLLYQKQISRYWGWNYAAGGLVLLSLIPIPKKLSLTEINVAENKTMYFLKSFQTHYFSEKLADVDTATSIYRESNSRTWGNPNYPLLHQKTSGSALAPFFALKETPPNVVFIIVESLSSPYSGKYAENASFTPFLDSLAEQSLYFPNFLATAQRTFAVLPSALGSLPHGKRGFTALKNNYPTFYSLPEYLITHGYDGTFFYGGHAAFDDMNSFVTQMGFTTIIDREEYNYEGTSYQTSIDPVPFGIGDRALFLNSWEEIYRRTKGPKLDVYLTLSMHYPFIFEDQAHYREKAEKIIRTVEYSNESMYYKMKKYTKELSSFLYTDDVLKQFFKTYAKQQKFQNTIFIIMGDHMMSEIPQKDEIEKYRAPCIIYSPLLKRRKEIHAVNTQLDITPSLISLFESRYNWPSPNNVHWLGQEFDTLSTYRNERTVAFMMNNRTMKDFMHNGYFVDGAKVHKMSNTGLFIKDEEVEDQSMIELKKAYESLHRNIEFLNNLFPSNEQKQLLYAHSQSEKEKIPQGSEFFQLVDLSLERGFETAEVSIEMTVETAHVDPSALLVFSIKRDESDTTFVRYWNKVEVTELLHPTTENSYVLKINHRIISEELNIQLGDRLSVYFWNPNGIMLDYVLSNKHIRISSYEE